MTSNWQSKQKKANPQDTKTINRLVDKRADFSVLEEGDTEATFQVITIHNFKNALLKFEK
jgi:hypothetical protein